MTIDDVAQKVIDAVQRAGITRTGTPRVVMLEAIHDAGFALVPLVPTEKMLAAATTYDANDRTGIIREEAEVCWQDMIEAYYERI